MKNQFRIKKNVAICAWCKHCEKELDSDYLRQYRVLPWPNWKCEANFKIDPLIGFIPAPCTSINMEYDCEKFESNGSHEMPKFLDEDVIRTSHAYQIVDETAVETTP